MQRAVAVLGGGVSGLAACFYLARSSQVPKVILLEGGNHLGGWIRSTRTENGATFEHGPRGIRPAGAVGRNTLLMISDLGLEGSILPVPGDHPASKNRYLYVGGMLHKLPSGIGSILRTVSPFTRPLLWSGLKELTAPRGSGADETIHAFVSRRFGQELADVAVDSLCRGVFAGDCRALSIRSCFPALFQAERTHRSVILGMVLGGGKSDPVSSPLVRRARQERWSQWSLRDGMQSLPEALADFLKRRGVEIRLNSPVRRLQRTASGSWEIVLADGSVKADHIISALPAKVLAAALPSWAEPLARELQAITAVSVGVVNLQYENVTLPVTGFGHLVPSFEDRSLLGIVYDSVAFPEQNGRNRMATRLTVMLGGAWFTPGFGDPDEVSHAALLSRAQTAVREHLGIVAQPSHTIVKVQKACIPQYTLGHWKHVENAEAFLEREQLPLSLVGASYRGVSVNDCISSSQRRRSASTRWLARRGCWGAGRQKYIVLHCRERPEQCWTQGTSSGDLEQGSKAKAGKCNSHHFFLKVSLSLLFIYVFKLFLSHPICGAPQDGNCG
ncbi:protoporphyrinogen oxidase isoform X3 [Varanus komodoensis]|uniref:protoporphyrinogen oxidase isoform X3 n=1 Tax=Varanus komodoensis TaxID=61221 RepID=UPI001CF79650|nr:protoporphyrinogen oxidase isoform X3 [Varanus komodoensis]